MESSKALTAALAGNPNTGKTTLFNSLTGHRQHTGNWPGKTVAQVTGELEAEGHSVHVVDLPGTYSLAAQSPEEVIARDFIVEAGPDVVVDIVDATNLERNLNLTLQILELTDRVVVALNVMDEAERQGLQIDASALEAALGVPVVPMVATRREGISKLVATMIPVAEGGRKTQPVAVDYGTTVEGHVERLEEDLRGLGFGQRARWLALKLLEDDPEIVQAFRRGEIHQERLGPNGSSSTSSREALQAVVSRADRLREATQPDAKVEIVRRRFEHADAIVREVTRRLLPLKESLTERVDQVVTHRVWAWPIMLALLGAVLWITIAGANVPSGWLAAGFSWLARVARGSLAGAGAPWWISEPLVDGLIVGTGTVIAVMLPPMVIFFTAFSALEDLGFIPRVAFNLDRLMRAVGSQGKHLLICAMSFGCNVTGVLTSRIIENEKDRMVAIVTSPLVICNGRFGAGIALVIVLFGSGAVPVMFSLVLLSLGAVLAATFLLNRTMFRKEPGGFVMELPPYRMPQWGGVIYRALVHQVGHVMGRAVLFAAPATLLIWFLGNVPRGAPFEETAIGWLVGVLAPAARPLGLTGEMAAALVFTLPAKEIIVASLAMTYGLQSTLVESEAVLDHIAATWTPLVSYTFMAFFMLYVPCLVTVWATWKETGSVKWTLMGVVIPLLMASVVAGIIYHGGRLLGLS